MHSRRLIGRYPLLKRNALIGAALALPLLATACGSSGGPSARANTGITIAINIAQPNSMDICDEQASTGPLLTSNVSEALTEVDLDNQQVKPLLATNWTNPAPLVWEFKLRQGVKFQNGAPFNAQAVAAWFNRLANAKADCYASSASLSDNVTGAQAKGSDVVDLHLKSADPIFPQTVSYVGIGAPSSDPLKKATVPVGTGPYKFVSYTPNLDLKLARWDGYWGPKPAVSSVDFQFRSESSVRSSMAKTKEADIATQLNADDLNIPGATAYQVSEALYYRIDVTLPPMNNLLVREAMNYAIDRKTLIENDYGGLGSPASQLYIPTVQGYNPKVSYTYDPAKAKSLLAQAAAAGVNIKAPIQVMGIADQYGSNASELEDTMSAMLNAVGLNTQTVIVPSYQQRLLNPFNPSYKAAIFQNFHGNSTGDALTSLKSKLGCKQTQSELCDKQLESYLTKASTESGAARTATLQQAGMYIYTNLVPLIPVMYLKEVMYVNPRLDYKPRYNSDEEIRIKDITFAGNAA